VQAPVLREPSDGFGSKSIVSTTAQRLSIPSCTIESSLISTIWSAGLLWEAKLDCDHGQERNQFSEIDPRLCVLDLWGWRFGVADPVGALRLEGFVKRAQEKAIRL
jgi:hypothetical protein